MIKINPVSYDPKYWQNYAVLWISKYVFLHIHNLPSYYKIKDSVRFGQAIINLVSESISWVLKFIKIDFL